MGEELVYRTLALYRSVQRSRRQELGAVIVVVLAVAQIWFVAFGLSGQSLADRASVAASMGTADAILLAAWQWRAQRREVSLEAYFSRLDLPNERRLAYYEQIVASGKIVGKNTLAAALEQFYAFYMYAELDNLEYAMTKYVDGSMTDALAERAAKTFVSRCRQSRDFREMACIAVSDSGYPAAFEAVVRELAACTGGDTRQASADRPHPMQYDELNIVRELRRLDA